MGQSSQRFSGKPLQPGTHSPYRSFGNLPTMFSAFIQTRTHLLEFFCEVVYSAIRWHVGSTKPFLVFRLCHAVWVGSPAGSHKEYTLLQCVRHVAAIVWQWWSSGELKLPQTAIWLERGEWLTVGLGMKCPGICKWLEGSAAVRDL